MPRNPRSTPRRFASLASIRRASRRRTRLALASGVILGLALPPLLGGAADKLPADPGFVSAWNSAARTHSALAWRPAPPRIDPSTMIRENPSERRRLDLRGMTRR